MAELHLTFHPYTYSNEAAVASTNYWQVQIANISRIIGINSILSRCIDVPKLLHT